MRRFLFLALFMLLAAAAAQPQLAFAQETMGQEKADIESGIPMDAQMKAAQAAYDAATKDLTKEQKEELSQLETEFAATMDPDARIIAKATEIKYCVKISNAFRARQEAYLDAFIVWRDELNAQQEKLWDMHKKKRSHITYVDQKVLDEYFTYISKMSLFMIASMITAAERSGGFHVDCADLGRRITLKQFDPPQPEK